MDRELHRAPVEMMTMRGRRPGPNTRGFSLLEVLVAGGILVSAALGIAPLFALAAQANLNARARTAGALLAAGKMEELRGLPWSEGAGEPGPEPSPPDALERNAPGFFDYLDAAGRPAGAGAVAPAQAVYVRRWSIEPLPADRDGSRILQVAVTTTAADARHARPPGGTSWRLWPGARIVTLARRRAP